VGLNLVSYKILDRNGVKAMPGSISLTNSGSFKKMQVGKWATPKIKKIKKLHLHILFTHVFVIVMLE